MHARDIETILPLTAAQEGMLFDVLSHGGEESYIEQGICDLAGHLQPEPFEFAWRQVAARHAALRTAIFWKGLSKPVQVIYSRANQPFDLLDWRDLPQTERESRLRSLLAEHRALGRILDRAPLMRLAVIQLEPELWRVVLSIHHLIHDAWSLTIMLRDVLALYAGNAILQPAGSYPDFVRYHATRDTGAETSFWRSYLDGTGEPSPLPYSEGSSSTTGWGNCREFLSDESTARFNVFCRQEQITLNSLVLGVWAATLAGPETKEVVFGCVSAGRPIEFPHVDCTVGLFINTLPMRVPLSADVSVGGWMQRLQHTQHELARQESLPLSRIKACSGKPSSAKLFESILVYQSAFEGVAGVIAGDLRVVSLETMGHPNSPLMFRVTPGDRTLFEIVHERARISDESARKILNTTIRIAGEIAANPGAAASTLWTSASGAKPGPGPRKRLGSIVPQPVAAGTQWVRRSLLESDGTRIALIEPQHPGVDLAAWAQSERAALGDDLKRFGGILFRAFCGMEQVARFRAFVQSMGGEPIDYTERSSPRRHVGDQIYTSTEHPPDQQIFFHNENSYGHTWPKRIFFYCAVEPEAGGETPLADVRSVYSHVPAALRRTFEDHGVLYVRNFYEHLGLSWRTAFQTEDREAVEQFCRGGGYEFEWVKGGLRTRRRAPAVCRHPDTSEHLWFNHAAFFHDTTLPADVRAALIAHYGEQALPNQTYFGDGSAIPEDAAETLRDAYRRSQIEFRWKAGDVLLLDNMLIAHARNPFRGPRKVLVSMTMPVHSLSPS
jgi:alpha-ketoglutarate-dependent taurine dioxygenase